MSKGLAACRRCGTCLTANDTHCLGVCACTKTMIYKLAKRDIMFMNNDRRMFVSIYCVFGALSKCNINNKQRLLWTLVVCHCVFIMSMFLMFGGYGHRWGNSFNHQEPKAHSTIWMIVLYLYLVVRWIISTYAHAYMT